MQESANCERDISIRIVFVSEQEQKRFSKSFPVTYASNKRVEMFSDTPGLVIQALLSEYKPKKVMIDVRYREYVERSTAASELPLRPKH